jgi:hypothetical protein
MAALSTPSTSHIAPAITSALDQSSFADTSSIFTPNLSFVKNLVGARLSSNSESIQQQAAGELWSLSAHPHPLTSVDPAFCPSSSLSLFEDEGYM